ncbi:MAG: hypothetical protein BWX71_02789 [Deltaproteobacteria bacterium ADurb.Bin072]|nr:MAG: hypothetical protein BWX71_02789 [Deltaproteobacteria bacterium ADurb.Bin072]
MSRYVSMLSWNDVVCSSSRSSPSAIFLMVCTMLRARRMLPREHMVSMAEAEMKSPASRAGLSPNTWFAVGLERRISVPSTTSSWSRLAVCMSSTV